MNNGLYAKCRFSETQLNAIRSIYEKHFELKMPADYTGTGIVALWMDNAVYPKAEDLKFDPTTSVRGFISEVARFDPLWEEFTDLLPYMRQSATITRITPGSVMLPHIDRAWRPKAIYFPIKDCSVDCISFYYDDNLQKIDSYSVYGNAYLTNVHKRHGIENKSNLIRVAFGWNFKDHNMSYDECYEILDQLGYIDHG